MKFLIAMLIITSQAFAAPKLQDADFMSAAQLIGAGGTASQLLNDSKMWSAVLGEQFSNALITGSMHSIHAPMLNGQFSTPANPPSGFDTCYVKSDDKFYCLSSAGIESLIGPGSGGGPPFLDSTFEVDNLADPTKVWNVSITAAASGFTDTFLFTQTADRLLTIPDATDTLVARSTVDTLQNKIIDASSNTIVNLTNASIASAGVANIARNKLASGAPDEVVINDGAGVLTSEAQLATSRGGTNHGDFTAGSVIFAGPGGTSLTEDNADFSWDNVTKILSVIGQITSSVSKTDSGVANLQFAATTHTTVDGSNTTVGLQGVATSIVDAAATNDKTVAAVIGTTTRGNGADDGVMHEMDGNYSILSHNSGAAGLTEKVIGSGFTLLHQQGTITDLYDFKPDSVPAGGAVTNYYGIYVPNSPFGGIKQSWIGDRTLIGGTSFTSPTAELDVNGMARIRDILSANVEISMTEIATPAPPAAGSLKFYSKNDDFLYFQNSAGVETQLSAATPHIDSDSFVLVGGVSPIDNADGIRVADTARTITAISCSMRNSGSSGNTVVTIHYGAALASTTTVTIPANSGLNHAETAPAISLAQFDYISEEITSVAVGAPEDLTCKIIY